MKNLVSPRTVRPNYLVRRSWNRPTARARIPTSTHGSCRAHHLPRHAGGRHRCEPRLRAQLLFLESEEPDKDINLYINSPGGEITALFAIYDTMKFIHADVSTFCFRTGGVSRRCAAGLGDPWQALRVAPRPRPAAPAFGGVEGQASDIELQAKEILRMRDMLTGCSPRTRASRREGVEDTDRDFIMTAEEAVAYGGFERGHHRPGQYRRPRGRWASPEPADSGHTSDQDRTEQRTGEGSKRGEVR